MNIPGIQGQDQRKVAVDVDFLSVQGNNPVPRLDALSKAASGVNLADGGQDKLLIRRKEAGQQHNAGEEIHGGTGGKDDHPLPPGSIGKCMGVVAGLVLPFHGTEAADGDAPDGIEGLANLLFENRRPHKQGEFVDLNTKCLGGDEMAKLMNKDEKAEQKNCEDITHRKPQTLFFTESLARRSVSRMSSSVGLAWNGISSTAFRTSR